MTIGERIRELRKSNNLTLVQFGSRIGIRNNTLSQIENGVNGCSNQIIISICREFGVSEKWLREGAGQMYIESDTFDLSEYIKQRGLTELESKILKTYFSFSKEERESIENKFEELWNSDNGSPDLHSQFPADPAELEAMYPVEPDPASSGVG